MTCLVRRCKRHRLPDHAHCEAHYRALLVRVFGRSAEYPL